MHGAHPARRSRAAGGSTHVRVALAAAAMTLAAAPAAHAQVPVPAPTGVVVANLPALPAAPRDCAAATALPAAVAPAGLRTALLCAINVERARHGLPALAANPSAEAAASSHARDMVRRRYFSHRRAGGPSLGRRLRLAGWRGRSAGEAIAYGCGTSSTPVATLRMWMNSPPHRAILLGSWSSAGVGVARKAPVSRCGGGATWVLDAVR
jgi:uncharacterized protein YkwD